MKLQAHYEELINTGNYCNCRVGITVQSDSEVPKENVQKVSQYLIDLAKKAVEEYIEKIKIEKELNNE